MKLLTWSQWLDDHIPYFEAERHRKHFFDAPPTVVLVVEPNDRLSSRRTGLRTWDEYLVDTKLMDHGAVPLFLENDARQEWYWAFWNRNEALMAVMKL